MFYQIHRKHGRRNHPRHRQNSSVCRCVPCRRFREGYGSGQRVFLSPVTLIFDLDVQTRPSEGTKHYYPVNLTQIRSAVPEILVPSGAD